MYVDGITFGFELEFICVFPDQQFREQTKELQYYEDTRAGAVIQRYLRHRGVYATGQEKPFNIDSDMEVDDDEDEAVAPPYSSWLIKDDSSLQLSPAELATLPAGYKQDPIEIASPKFRAHQRGNMAIQLNNLLTALQEMERDTGCLFLTNATCGFHVHIGHTNGGPSLATAKRVMQLFTAHERNFDALHLANRIENMSAPTQNIPVPCYAPLSFFGRNYELSPGETPAQALGANPATWNEQDFRPARSPTDNLFPTNAFAIMARIEATRSLEELGMLLYAKWAGDGISGHSCTVNFDNLFADEREHRFEETLTRTIEFRQHAGTLDPEEITNYVNFLIHAVVYCESVTDEVFFALLITGAHDDVQLHQLVRLLGASADETQYLCRDKTKDPLSPPRLRASQQPLVPLNAVNHTEKCANYDPRSVHQRIENKLATGYYGWDPEVFGMEPSFDRVRNMLLVANRKMSDSIWARTYAFAALSRAYHRIRNTIDRTGAYVADPMRVELTLNWHRQDFQ